MRRLLIVGAGGFGREVLNWVRDIEPTQSEWEIGGFLDANPAALSRYGIALPVLGDPSEFVPEENDRCVCAIGDPTTKQEVVRRMGERGATFINLVHPSVVLGSDCRLGTGCVLCPGTVLTTNIHLGDFVTVNLGSTVGHDSSIGDWCSLMVHVDIAGRAHLGLGVLAGSHAFVLQGVRVGDHAVVGAGSVVTRNVPPNTTVFGNPAKEICVNTARNFGRSGGAA